LGKPPPSWGWRRALRPSLTTRRMESGLGAAPNRRCGKSRRRWGRTRRRSSRPLCRRPARKARTARSCRGSRGGWVTGSCSVWSRCGGRRQSQSGTRAGPRSW